MKHGKTLTIAASAAFAMLASFPAFAKGRAENRIFVDCSRVKCDTSRDLWGLFFEDIDLSLDGGIFAELVRNGSFEEGEITRWNKAKPLAYWKVLGATELTLGWKSRGERVATVKARKGDGIANEGFFGIAAKKGARYNLSCMIKGNAHPLEVSLERIGAGPVAKATIPPGGGDWKEHHLVLQASDTDAKCVLAFRTTQDDSFEIDRVSLFPEDAVAGLFRRDLVEKLAALKPRFLRFPGGCWVEGETMKEAYRWKKTLAPRWERRPQWNLWQYWSSNAVGFYEYLVLCEVLGAKPLFCINVGMSHRETVPMDKMGEFVQDALDCIEFCNGSVDTKWGKVRADMGHPAPFNLAYLEIGNENWGEKYDERYALFHDAVSAKYPDIKLIANYFQNYHVKSRPVAIEDDHYYESADWMMSTGARRYDSAERAGKAWFIGEYATQREVGFWGDLRGAIGEAAFMVGLERNSDLVTLAAYAPLFANVEHSVWAPNLIYVSTDSCFANPSYEVMRLFAENRTSRILECAVQSEKFYVRPADKWEETDAIVANAAISEDGKSIVVKVVNCSESPREATLALSGADLSATYSVTRYPAEDGLDRDAHNSMYAPNAITSAKFEKAFDGEARNSLSVSLAPLSFNIYTFPLVR